MTEKELFREIGMIDEKYVAEAEEEVKKAKPATILTPTFKRTLVTAACLCVCIGLYFSVRQANRDFSEGAAGGSGMSMMQTESCVNGASTGEVTKDAGMAYDTMSESEEMTQEAGYQDNQETASEPTDGAVEEYKVSEESDENVVNDVEREDEYKDTEVESQVANDIEVMELSAFVERVLAKEAATVKLEQYTIEGAVVYYFVQYNGNVFYIQENRSRDAFASEGDSLLAYTYKYFAVFEEENVKTVVFANEEIESMEQMKEQEIECLMIMQ